MKITILKMAEEKTLNMRVKTCLKCPLNTSSICTNQSITEPRQVATKTLTQTVPLVCWMTMSNACMWDTLSAYFRKAHPVCLRLCRDWNLAQKLQRSTHRSSCCCNALKNDHKSYDGLLGLCVCVCLIAPPGGGLMKTEESLVVMGHAP